MILELMVLSFLQRSRGPMYSTSGRKTLDLWKDISNIDQLLLRSYTPEGVRQWWNRPRVRLDGLSPYQAMLEGETDKVRELAVSLETGCFT